MDTANGKPLAGKRIVVTRAPEQAGDFICALEDRGAEVLLLPAVTFEDPSDTAPLDQAIAAFEKFDWVIFTSQNSVHFFLKRSQVLGRKPDQAPSGRRPLIAAVGPMTATVAREQGFCVDFIAAESNSYGLAEELGPHIGGRKVLLPRSDRAAADLPEALRGAGAAVTDVVAYQTCAPEMAGGDVIGAIRRGDVDVVTFFSPSAVRHLADEVGWVDLRNATDRVVLATIGPTTARALNEMRLPVQIEAREASADSLVVAICEYYLQRNASGAKAP